MRKLAATLTLTVLAALIAANANASPKSGATAKNISKTVAKTPTSAKITLPIKTTTPAKTSTPKSSVGKIVDYHLSHGTKFAHGYFYKGKHHSHWSCTRWDPRYGCHCYWDPCCLGWYYWCEIDVCYYPVAYVPYGCYTCRTVAVEPVAVEVLPVVGTRTAAVRVETAEPVATENIPPIPAPVVNKE